MSVLGRVGAVSKVLASHRDEPVVRARAARIAGTALIADGLVGLENPLGKQSRSGILGAIVLTVVGVLLFTPAAALGRSLGPYADGIVITGEVASVSLPSSSDSSSCGMTFRYAYEGQSYERSPSYAGSSFCDLVVGDTVEVSLVPSDPARGRLTSDGTSLFATWIPRAPWLLVVAGAWTTLVRLVEIVVGIRLLLWGRRVGREEAPSGTEERVLAELKRAWGGEPAAAPGGATA